MNYLLTGNLKSVIIFLLLSLSSFVAHGQHLDFLTDEVSYLWPTNSSKQISSTFGETRSAHLHAGLDIRSFGREGFEVYATRDGYVHRIGMGPHGYGNVIYLKHNDGSFSVYAHLNRFEAELQAYADSIRLEKMEFDLDKDVEENTIYYKKGDVIAYTGSTGVGPPHLHFELRTPDFKPFNPLLTNLNITDTLSPVFSQLAIEFKDPESFHPTGFEIFNAISSGNTYDFGSIDVSGPFGISVEVSDKVNSTPNSYAVYSLMMIADGDTLFHSVADYFPYQYSNHMFLDRSYPILAQTRKGFQRLFLVNGNNLPFYQEVKNRGILWPNKGLHEVEIVAKDIFGNTSSATVSFNVKDDYSNSNRIVTEVPTYPSSESVRLNNIFEADISAQTISNSPLLASANLDFLPFIIKTNREKQIEPDGTVTQILTPDKRSVFSNPDKSVWLDFPSSSLYDTLTLKMSIIEDESGLSISFNPNRLPIHEPVSLKVLISKYFKDTRDIALYSIDEFRNRKYFINSSTSEGILRADLHEISSLYITKDNKGPWTGMARIGKDLAGNQLVIFPVRDEDSGIDYRRSVITVNGERGLTGYDPDKSQLYFYKPGFSFKKINEATIIAFDRVGNQTNRTSSFRYIP